MIETDLLPAAPGTYTEWPILFGAPTHWQAVQSETDISYVQSSASGLRDSCIPALPEIRSDDTLISLVLSGWMSWAGGPLPQNAKTMAFYRLYGTDRDLVEWSVPPIYPADPSLPGPILAMTPVAIPDVTGSMLRDGGFEFGVRRTNTRKVNLHAIRVSLSVVPYSERLSLVGSGGVLR